MTESGFEADLPGADLVAAGIEALKRGEPTVEALLVSVGSPRLRAAGLEIPAPPPLEHSPEIELYLAIGEEHPADAHSRYNALIRRLVSFERAPERQKKAGDRWARPPASQARTVTSKTPGRLFDALLGSP